MWSKAVADVGLVFGVKQHRDTYNAKTQVELKEAALKAVGLQQCFG